MIKKAAFILPLFVFLAACGSQSGAPTPKQEVEASAEPISEADKAAIDKLGTDFTGLSDAFLGSSGAKKDYAEDKLVVAINLSKDVTALDALVDKLAPKDSTLPSRPHMMARVRATTLRNQETK